MIRQNTISGHVIQFCRFLRNHKYALGPNEQASALSAVEMVPFTNAIYFKNALKCTLVKSKVQLDKFDDLYLQYWNEVEKAESSKTKEIQEEKQEKTKQKAPSIQVLKKWLHGNRDQEKIEMATYSAEEIFNKSTLGIFGKEEMSEAIRISQLLVKKLSNSKSRRMIRTKNIESIDLRKMIRKNILKSEEIMFLSFKRRKIEKLKLILICDVSRSMELYTKFLIQFMYSLNRASAKIETFVFSSSLARISKSVKHNDLQEVLEDLQNSFDHWSGGTRIGSCLLEFVNNYSNITMDKKTNIIILSDGWDTDKPELTEEAMKRISKKCNNVIWLNPLAASPNFKPEVACLKAAWPYIDIFQAANDLESLKQLILKLN